MASLADLLSSTRSQRSSDALQQAAASVPDLTENVAAVEKAIRDQADLLERIEKERRRPSSESRRRDREIRRLQERAAKVGERLQVAQDKLSKNTNILSTQMRAQTKIAQQALALAKKQQKTAAASLQQGAAAARTARRNAGARSPPTRTPGGRFAGGGGSAAAGSGSSGGTGGGGGGGGGGTGGGSSNSSGKGGGGGGDLMALGKLVVDQVGDVLGSTREMSMAMTKKYLNDPKGGGAVADFKNEFAGLAAAQTNAARAAVLYNGNIEETKSVLANIANETITDFSVVGESMEALERLRFMQLGTLDELGGAVTERVNAGGLSVKQSVSEMEDVASYARGIERNTVTGNVISMTDFYKAVRKLKDESGSLSLNQKDLAKNLAKVTNQAQKLGMTYDRTMRGSEGLMKSLTSGYGSTGFAVVDARENLKVAMADAQRQAMEAKTDDEKKTTAARLKDLEFLQSEVSRGAMLPDELSKYLSETGELSSDAVVQNTLKNFKGRGAASSGAMMQALFGREDITLDERRVAKLIFDEYEKTGDASKALGVLTPEDRALFPQREKLASTTQFNAATAAEAVTEAGKVGVAATAVQSAAQTLPGAREGLDTGTKSIQERLRSIPEEIMKPHAIPKMFFEAAKSSNQFLFENGMDLIKEQIDSVRHDFGLFNYTPDPPATSYRDTMVQPRPTAPQADSLSPMMFNAGAPNFTHASLDGRSMSPAGVETLQITLVNKTAGRDAQRAQETATKQSSAVSNRPR